MRGFRTEDKVVHHPENRYPGYAPDYGREVPWHGIFKGDHFVNEDDQEKETDDIE